ncbi:hypothetical protein Syn7803C102_36 [Synechococcus phage ACG-2014d]|jgi:hypothetical protein|uniref:Uncharacterized protein n=1 Tax=Synechococcus phage ACG-2014d TaxID=1493509 RepID=A0A0E3I2C2_9CAUD|nr:hypothetical protein AAJ59_gp036 [Synechococcus phage ACG-2014d]AIX14867.1 hypothetical protein Syn7803C46_36 [Synechococcus phage ACG-2014d]AIX15294.1 hypothetical protein Syn7803C48_36 [Synechococcus phage ACG-2014d]AIX15512.1 hypothetical protein Syn7803C49_36 [Synechococcus phage ACG-2014d]AIX16158.1 hypothetical protein Syn7803C55_33 [Synechococcus phage ACG-2014d]AIX16343.1 hypothetical protein Syn7803C57_36 [Synechococcus phage ACG-2014d]
MFSTDLLYLCVDRALGCPIVGQGDLFEELYNLYMNDSNSSTLREHITAEVAGCDAIPGKLGRDAKDKNTGQEKEVKPKNYTGKTTNGSGCFNDYTRARFVKDRDANLPIIQSFFIDGVLAYVIEFEFEAIADRLDQQVTRICEEQGNRYVRSCSWSYADYITHKSLKVHHLNRQLLDATHVKGQYKVCNPFYEHLKNL